MYGPSHLADVPPPAPTQQAPTSQSRGRVDNASGVGDTRRSYSDVVVATPRSMTKTVLSHGDEPLPTKVSQRGGQKLQVNSDWDNVPVVDLAVVVEVSKILNRSLSRMHFNGTLFGKARL